MAGYLYGLDPETPIFRIVPVDHFLSDLGAKQTRLVLPSTWEDPQEDAIAWMAFSFEDDQPRHQVFAGQYLPPVYAQCWSRTHSSDPLWRVYSRVHHKPDGRQDGTSREGLQLGTTPAKLLKALSGSSPIKERCFVGAMRYVPVAGVSQDIVNEVGSSGLDSFVDPVKRALVALSLMRRSESTLVETHSGGFPRRDAGAAGARRASARAWGMTG